MYLEEIYDEYSDTYHYACMACGETTSMRYDKRMDCLICAVCEEIFYAIEQNLGDKNEIKI